MTPCTVLHQVLVLVLPFILLFSLPLSLPLSLPHPNQIRIVLYNDTKDRIILYNATIRSPAGIHFSPRMVLQENLFLESIILAKCQGQRTLTPLSGYNSPPLESNK